MSWHMWADLAVVVLFLRGVLVSECRTHRLKEIHAYNCAVMHFGIPQLAKTSAYSRLGSGWQQMLDLSRWTYRQFYPHEMDAKYAIEMHLLAERIRKET